MNEYLYNQFQLIGRRTLPILVKPLPDELLSSWIMRYSQALLTKSHTFCRFIYPKENVWNRDIDLNASDEFIKALADKCFLSESEVYNTTLKSYRENLFVDTLKKWIIPIRIYHRTRKGSGQMFCPSCLEKDHIPYFRKKWRLSLSVVCPFCRILLVDKCPRCSSPIAFHRLEVGAKEGIMQKDLCCCFKCSFDLRNAPRTKADYKVTKTQEHFYTLLDTGYNETVQYSHLYFDVIHQLVRLVDSRIPKFKEFDKALSRRSSLPYSNRRSNRLEFDKKEIRQRLLLIRKVGWLLEKWPERILEISIATRTYSSYLLRDMKNPPYWYWKLVMENTYVVYTPWRQLDPRYSYLGSYKIYLEKKTNKVK